MTAFVYSAARTPVGRFNGAGEDNGFYEPLVVPVDGITLARDESIRDDTSLETRGVR